MQKIVIIGLNGAGKTTLANELSPLLKIKAYHLDRLFWRPGWKGKDRETRIDILQKLAQEKKWIIEGTYLKSSGPRLQAADTLIFLDTPWLVCLLRVLKRYHQYSGLSRRDIPDECTVNLTLPRFFKILVISLRERRELLKLVYQFPEKVIRLHSAKQVEDFLVQPEMYVERLRKAQGAHLSYDKSVGKTLKVTSPGHLIPWMFEKLAQGVKHVLGKLTHFINRNIIPQASVTPRIDQWDASVRIASISPDFDALLEGSHNPQESLPST